MRSMCETMDFDTLSERKFFVRNKDYAGQSQRAIFKFTFKIYSKCETWFFLNGMFKRV